MSDLDHQAEQIVLGSMLLDPGAIDTATTRLRSGDFADVRHGSIFAAITANHATGADTGAVAVAHTLARVDELARSGGGAYLHTLIGSVPTTASVGHYAGMVADAAQARADLVDATRLAQVVEAGDRDRIEACKAELVQRWTGTGPGPDPGLDVATLRERLARPTTPLAYRIDELQPVGARVILPAQYKAGKTTLVGNWARCLVDGDAFLGRYKVAPIEGALVLLDFEMGTRQLDEWLRDQRIVNDDRVVVVPLRGRAAAFNILDPGVRARWARLLRQHGCAYVLWDCLRPVLDALGLDEHREAGRVLTAFDALLREAEVDEAGVVHHMGHGAERSRGDSRLRDWPDVEWRLVRQDDDPASPRFLSAYGRDVDVAESALTYDRVTRRLTIGGGSRRDAAARDALGAILELLADSPRLSGRAIEDRIVASTEHPRASVRAGLKAGVRDGWVTTEQGPHRAVLHSPLRPQCASAPRCAASAPAHLCECASALIEAHTHRALSTGRSAPNDDPT